MSELSTFEEQVLAAVDPDELWRTVCHLATLDRTSGHAGEYEAVDWIASQLAEYGVTCEIYEFDSLLSFPIRASLRVLAPEQRELRAKTRAFGASTPPQGLEGEMVFVPSTIAGIGFQAGENQYAGRDVRGKIVLSQRGGPDGVYDAMQAGAVAHVHCWPSDEDAIHEMIATSVWGTPTPESASRIPTIPSLSVNAEGGRYLQELCTRGPVQVRLLAQTDTRWCRERMPVATIPARTGAPEFFLVGGHLDAWYVGVTDNATGNAAMLELARCLNLHRDRLDRAVKIGWWVGHSYGRYSGSTWYCDNFFADLRNHCVGYIDIDSPGVKGATVYDNIPAMAGTHHLVTSAVKAVTGTEASCARPPRAGDYSFYGPGIPAMFMLMGNLPPEQRAAVGGSGGGWFWHTEYDTLEWADPAVLSQDTRIYALAILRVIQSAILPYRYGPVADELRLAARDIEKAAAEHFDLSAVSSRLADLAEAAVAADAAIDRIPAGHAEPANRALLAAQRELIPINYTRCGPYDHDPAVYQPVMPLLDDARRLANLDPSGSDYRFTCTRLVRSRNLILDHLDAAIAALREAARLAE